VKDRTENFWPTGKTKQISQAEKGETKGKKEGLKQRGDEKNNLWTCQKKMG